MFSYGDKTEEIINYYGVLPQLKYFQSEVFELNEAIISFENESGKKGIDDIAEEIADCYVMLEQFRKHYDISIEDIKKIGRKKIDRQIERIENERNRITTIN